MNLILENAELRKEGEECGSCKRPNPIACGYAGFCELGLQCVKDSMISDELGKCVSKLSKLKSRKLISHTSYKRLCHHYFVLRFEHKIFDFYLAPKCPGDLVYSNCHSACPPYCNVARPDACITVCVPGCECPAGLYRDGEKCYKKSDCPSSPGNPLKII